MQSDQLKWEAIPSGEQFPHLYGPLPWMRCCRLIATGPAMNFDLALIEQQAAARICCCVCNWGCRPLQTLRVVVARRSSDQSLALLGELKGWSTPSGKACGSTRCACKDATPKMWGC